MSECLGLRARSVFSKAGIWCLYLCLGIVGAYVPNAKAAKPVQTTAQSILTYHYDALRTGWNNNETTLTPANFTNFNPVASVQLDEQVDGQPLLVPD